MNRHIFTYYRIGFALILIMMFSACASMATKQAPVNCTPIDASSMQGAIKGTWKGIAYGQELSGEFNMTVSPDGKITGNYTGSTINGDFSGCVDSQGNIQAHGGSMDWLGHAEASNGKVSAKGTWILGSGQGTWSGQK